MQLLNRRHFVNSINNINYKEEEEKACTHYNCLTTPPVVLSMEHNVSNMDGGLGNEAEQDAHGQPFES